MGHKDIQTTLDIYAEITESKKIETFASLANNLNVFQEGIREYIYPTKN